MNKILYFDKKKYISSKHAGSRCGFTHDYISRLCRQGKLEGKKVGNSWYVKEEAFEVFLKQNTKKREKQKKDLSKKQKQEYNKFQKAPQPYPQFLPDPEGKHICHRREYGRSELKNAPPLYLPQGR